MNYFHIALILFLNINIFVNLESQSFDESLYITTWSTSNAKTLSKNFPPINLSDNSLRQIFRVSTSGEYLRVKFSNRYGNTILKIRKVTISVSVSQGTSEIDIQTIKVLTFSGKDKINIEPGSEIYSDTIEYNLKALSEVAISIYFGIVPTDLTGHGNSITNSFIDNL